MKVRRLGASLQQLREATILLFLAPSVPRIWIPRFRLSPPLHTTSIKSFTTSAQLSQEPPESETQQRSTNEAFNANIKRNKNIQDLLGEALDYKSNSPTLSSADVLQQNAFRSDRYRSEAESRAERQGAIVRRMQMPGETREDATLRASASVANSNKHLVPRNTLTIKSRPSLGRTVEVKASGVAAALQTLEAECRRNNIRVDQKRQRFHERPGLKRKRLKSERWRKRFKIAFKANVQKVQEMRRKGW